MKLSAMVPSSYLKQDDFDENGLIVTVAKFEQKNVAPVDQPVENKWLIYFREFDKAMVLNNTNISALSKACETDDMEECIGKELVVYVDPNVSFGGKTVGGLRIKKYVQPAPPKRRAPGEDDV